MPQVHVQDIPALGSIQSGLRQAVTLGMVADADFATDKATTLANIATRNAKILAGMRADVYGVYLALIDAVRLGFSYLGAATMIQGTAVIYAAIPGTWQPGFAVTI